jgi:hypothetical protein
MHTRKCKTYLCPINAEVPVFWSNTEPRILLENLVGHSNLELLADRSLPKWTTSLFEPLCDEEPSGAFMVFNQQDPSMTKVSPVPAPITRTRNSSACSPIWIGLRCCSVCQFVLVENTNGSFY